MIYKDELANSYGVSEKTLLRDISDLRMYYQECHYNKTIIYDKKKNGYYLSDSYNEKLTNAELLSLSKILLESRVFTKDEITTIINKLLSLATKKDQIDLKNIIYKELFHYVPLQHNKPLVDLLWSLTKSINRKEYVEIAYSRRDGTSKKHKIRPVAMMFSEFYFYVIAFIGGIERNDPTVFRVDRITSANYLDEHFEIPYIKEFNDGEFRKRVFFMQTGNLHTVRFIYKDNFLEPVFDRLPTSRIIGNQDGFSIIEAEAYGDGIYMWLNSQGEKISILN